MNKVKVKKTVTLSLLEAYFRNSENIGVNTNLENGCFQGKTEKTISALQRFIVSFKRQKKAGIKRGQGVHTLRHAFATHLLSQGTDLYTISRLLGHTSIKTTVVYLHLIPERITNIKSPLDHLYEKEGGPSDE